AKAEGEPGWTVPAGYNEYDYNKCAAFLEQTDENGVKNGEKMGSSYDPNDPGTWVWGVMKGFSWIEVNGEQRVRSIQLYGSNLCGGLDLSGCTSLDYIQFNGNSIIELDVTGCTALEHLYCSSNNLTEVDVTSCSALRTLGCGSNNLTELDVTQNPALYALDCSSNNLTELDLSNNQDLPYDHIRAEGSGFVGCELYLYDGIIIYAYPMNGVVLEGFYDENGELVSEGEWDDSLKAYKYDCRYFGEKPTGTINARFSILGDINGDGEVTPMDALLLMRFCMGVLDENQVDSRRADVNGDGAVDLMDANAVLRITIGLE
ncbi:MAG: hypothetical protein IJM18_09970, partial [Clostridia bacterium]|nr:hypothetical protein [Clostridia bacterium]